MSGNERGDVAYGAGWVTAEDRGLLLGLIRGPARAAALDIPGIDPFQLALSGKTFVPSARDGGLPREADGRSCARSGPLGRRMVAIVTAYAAGHQRVLREDSGCRSQPYTRERRRRGGGSDRRPVRRERRHGGAERRCSSPRCSAKLGATQGHAVFADLRRANDPEAPVSIPGSFPQEQPATTAPGSVVLDDGSRSSRSRRRSSRGAVGASNALLVGAKRSATGHPLFVAGPQVGYFFPEFFAGGRPRGRRLRHSRRAVPRRAVRRRSGAGRTSPGARRRRRPTTSTSSSRRSAAATTRTTCTGPVPRDDDASTPAMLSAPGHARPAGASSARPSTARSSGYATVDGHARRGLARSARPAAASCCQRPAFYATQHGPRDARRRASSRRWRRSSSRSTGSTPTTATSRSSRAGGCRCARPAPTRRCRPTGTGEYEWQRLPARPPQHPQAINPPSGVILNWNNKPARGRWAPPTTTGRTGRSSASSCSRRGIARSEKHTLADVVSAMNNAATQDLRVVAGVAGRSRRCSRPAPAPSPRAAQARELARGLARRRAASRLDRDLDGKIDDPGAAIMDAAWPPLADAVMTPGARRARRRASPQLDIRATTRRARRLVVHRRLVRLRRQGPPDAARRPVKAPFSTRYCGGGDLAACRDGALGGARRGRRRRSRRRRAPTPPRGAPTRPKERIGFSTGIIPDTMRWTNRPTFQQVMTFTGHRRLTRATGVSPDSGSYARGHAAEALSLHAGPDTGAAGGAGGDGGAGHPPPLARLQGRLRASASRGCGRCSGPRTRCSSSPPPAPAPSSRPSPTSSRRARGRGRLARRLRRALAEDGRGVRLRRRRARPTTGAGPRAEESRGRSPRVGREGRVARALGDLDRRRLPTSRRSPPLRRMRARSSSSTRSRASARFRSRPTPGGSTSSSPARRRR